MYFWIVNCSLAFLLCVLCASIVIPQILLIAFRKQLFDLPDERKIHHCAVPRLGGIAFKPVVFFTIALLLGINMALGHSEMLSEIGNNVRPLAFAFCSIMVLYLVGMADDLIGIRYRAKFVIQILCGVMLIAGGIYINNLHGILGIHAVPLWLGYPLTILIVVFIINAINLIDGIYGLASGLTGSALLVLGSLFLFNGMWIYALLSFATLGVLVPFFYYNVFGQADHGRKIFMGDTGSLTLGYILVFLAIRYASYNPDVAHYSAGAIVVAFSTLIVPMFDVVRVMIVRARSHRSLFKPDRNHIHHKFLDMGMSAHKAMISIVVIASLFSSLNILLVSFVNINIVFAGDIVIWVILSIWFEKAGNKKEFLNGKEWVKRI